MPDADPIHVDNLYQDLVNTIVRGVSPEEARSRLRAREEGQYGRYPEVLELRSASLEAAYQRYIEKLNQVAYVQKRILRYGRRIWYVGPVDIDSLWNRHKARLAASGRTEEEIERVDEDSTTLVGLLDCPSGQAFSTRGLVVGHVQSGKTGNMAAVIAKAADTEFKFFLILSGLTDQLRNQTQERLEKDIVRLAPERWMKWTEVNAPDFNGDFSERATGGFSFDHRNQIAVIKKNASILRRFLAKLIRTDQATLRNTPFLIIDDECDQASVNSSSYDHAVTKINELIRRLMQQLPRASYVGYTATPFATVLIDTTVTDDLYPRDFIYALHRPTAYFGAQELFGRHALAGDYDDGDDGYDMIRLIPDAQIGSLRPAGGGNGQVVMNDSLRRAMRYFLMVVAARRARGQTDRHNTMLIHTSVLNTIHRKTEAVVEPYRRELAERLAASDAAVLEAMKAEWSSESGRVLSELFDRTTVPFESLRPHLAAIATEAKVHVENWTATERLRYPENDPKIYIVIGGNVLARGLTLEGLSVSYFLRSSSQYDTLMQMGRWFGYREGFEDLPRVWVEERIREAFFDLATIENEVRDDIRRYGEEEMTPRDFAVRIRQIPGMTITAAAKMRHAVPVRIGYAGEHVQTFRFRRRDMAQLRSNWTAGAELIDAIASGAERIARNHVFRDVPAAAILRFLDSYEPHSTHRNLERRFLSEYIRTYSADERRLQLWSVVVVGADAGDSKETLGRLGHVPLVLRSAEAESAQDDASIKALMSRRDVLLDLPGGTGGAADSWDELKRRREDARANALLLLYPIQARSEPRPGRRGRAGEVTREALNALHDVMGYGIVFPGPRDLSGTYVAANLDPDPADATEELLGDDRIPEQILDAPDSVGVA